MLFRSKDTETQVEIYAVMFLLVAEFMDMSSRAVMQVAAGLVRNAVAIVAG